MYIFDTCTWGGGGGGRWDDKEGALRYMYMNEG